MTEFIQAVTRFRRLLLTVGVLAAFAAACTAAAPAIATNEYFECGSCTVKNGPENWVTNTQGINHSGKGGCVIVWWNRGGGNYEATAIECFEGGNTGTACSYSEHWGHGEIETSGGNSYLRGRQDNYKSCG